MGLLQVVREVVVQVPPTPPAPPMPPDPFPAEMIPTEVITGGPPEWVGIVFVIMAGIIGATIVLLPLVRAWARRIDRGGSAPQALAPGDTSARLERIETAVEAMALEVERISEGQRFLTRVMTELRSLPGAPAERASAEPPYRTPR